MCCDCCYNCCKATDAGRNKSRSSIHSNPLFSAGDAAYDGGEGEYDDGRSGCDGGDGGGCDSAVVDATAEEVIKIKPISSILRSVNSN